MNLAPQTRNGKTVGCYDLLEKIGEGGMGTVYKARNQTTGELVAVKLLPPEKGSSIHLKRFEQEFRAALRLDHPHIVRVLDFGSENNIHYLAMELVNGPSLGTVLATRGRLPESEATEIIMQIATALQQAHANGMVHRDIKPDNILLAPGGVAKLADLGLVKMMGTGIDLTRPNSGLGTPNYMAPEQFHDAKHADPRCDIYSLGATLYTAVTGQVPFRASSPMNVLKKKQRCELPSARLLVPSLSEHVERTIVRSMNLDPHRRHANCQEFLAELSGKSLDRPVLAPRSDTSPRPHKGRERRAEIRYPSHQEGHCLPLASSREDRWTARILDVSRKGIGLLVNRRFEIGTVLILYIRESKQKDPRCLMVRVARQEPRPARKWVLGCTFAQLLGEEDLQILT